MSIFKYWRTTTVLTANEAIGNAGRVYKANAVSGAQTHAVVAPSTDGRELYVVKTDSSSNTVTLTLTLDGSAQTIVLAYKGDAVKLYDDGTTWTVLGNRPSAASLSASFGNMVNVRAFGAKGDGVVDDTSAIAAAVAAAQSATAFGVKAGVYFPPGNYVTTSAVAVTSSMTIRGQSRLSTAIINKTASAGIFTIAADSVVVQDIYFQSQATAAQASSSTASAIIYTSGDRGVIERCYFYGWFRSLWFQSCGSWSVRSNWFGQAVQYNLFIQNTGLPDSGDQDLSGNYFAAGTNAGWTGVTHIHQESAGGLRMVSNKILQGAVGYELAPADGIATSILIIEGNSFEYQTTSAINLVAGGTAHTGTFKKILIGPNQFTGDSCAGGVINIAPSATGLYSAIKILGGIFSGTSGSTTFLAVNNVDNIQVDGLSLTNGATGLYFGSGATNVHIGSGMKFQGVTTPVLNNSPSPVLNQLYQGVVITPPSGAATQSSLYVYTTGGTAAFTVSASNGNALFAGGLRVGGAFQNTASLWVSPTNTYPGILVKAAGGSVDLLQFQAQSTTAAVLSVDQYGHVVAPGTTAPSLAAAAGAGASPTVALTSGSSDTAGVLTVTVGNSPAANALAVLTFGNAFTAAPRAVTLTPMNSATTAAGAYIGAKAGASFQVNLAQAPTAGAVLSWAYHVIG